MLINYIIELGNVSELTQGSERGWFEFGRPGHDKYRSHTVVELGNASKLTRGAWGNYNEYLRPNCRKQ